MGAASAVAQPAAPKPTSSPSPAAAPAVQPVSTEPSSTTASFADWVLRCQRVSEAAKASRICEVAQILQSQGQQAPIAQIAIGRAAAGEPLRVTAVMPVSVTFPSVVQITIGEKDTKPLELGWRRCIPSGCFADAPLGDDVVKQWRKAAEAGRIVFRDAAGRDLALPLSVRGLDQAIEALAKERL
ncbi:MAG TPA: invasion associated locus B family protein [Bosea sp. (in: a-proteobacteria)]|jgi:invasion protein IalB|nr:invasion associated locus B family protein [Bosea sp. (in: a-proteobacteria)]